MKNPFSYSARRDSVGLNCAFCLYLNDTDWSYKKDYACGRHKIPLTVTVEKSGFKDGEWFCSAFADKGNGNKNTIGEFQSIRPNLESNILYGAYSDIASFKEIPFNDL